MKSKIDLSKFIQTGKKTKTEKETPAETKREKHEEKPGRKK